MMFRSLNFAALGISGRQSELIELALTHGFPGLEVEVDDLLKRAEAQGVDAAARFLVSAQLQIGGFELPLRWGGTDAEFQADLGQLPLLGELAAAIGAQVCFATITSVGDDLPYHEDFDRHRARLIQVGDQLRERGVKIAVNFTCSSATPQGEPNPIIHTAESFVSLLGGLPAESVGILLDSWHWVLGGGTPEVLAGVLDRVVAVRLADYCDQKDVGQLTAEDRLLPGVGGGIDNGSIVRLLHERNYQGPVSVYPHPAQFLGMTREAIVEEAVKALDGVWVEAGLTTPPPGDESDGLAEGGESEGSDGSSGERVGAGQAAADR